MPQPVISVLLNAEYPISKLAELGRLSEELGYRCLWYTDLRFATECFIGLAAIAAKTSRILAELAGGHADGAWGRRLRELANPPC